MSVEMRNRVVFALVMVAIALTALMYDFRSFTILVIIVASIGYWEWLQLMKLQSFRWWVVGMYIVLAAIAAIHLRIHAGVVVVGWLIAVTVATDIGAMWAGKTLGKRFPMQLAPIISPKKTVVGLIGGMAAAMLVSVAFVIWLGSEVGVVPLAAVLAIVAQLGDLFESYIKRQVGVKDSGNLIPGHGGVLDRLDGHLFVLPVGWILWVSHLLPFS